MILIEKKVNTPKANINLKQYLAKEYSVTILGDKQKMLFLREHMQSFMVLNTEQVLQPISMVNPHKAQLESLIGEIWLDESFLDPTKYRHTFYYMANDFISNQAKFTGEIAICHDNRLVKTVNENLNKAELQNQIFELHLAKNELISYLKTELEINGEKIHSEMEVTEIKEMAVPEEYKAFLNYSISSKAA